MRPYGQTLTFIIVLLFTAAAHSGPLQKSEQKFTEIVGQFSTPYIVNAMFRCYHLGRLQGFADVLAVQVHQLSSRQTKNPQKQAAAIAHGQQLHFKADHLLSGTPPGNIYDCDPQFANQKPKRAPLQADQDIVNQIRTILRNLRGFAGEEVVLNCFHTGRLSLLTARLSEMIKQPPASGQKSEPNLHMLLNASARAVAKRSRGCKAQSIY